MLVPDRQQRLQQLMRSFEEQAKKAAQIQAVMKDLRGTARSADGSVTVTVAPSGAVLGLQLSPGAVRKSHVALQTEIMQTIRQATQNAAQQLESSLAPILGDQLERFKQGMNAGQVEPIMPDDPAPSSGPQQYDALQQYGRQEPPAPAGYQPPRPPQPGPAVPPWQAQGGPTRTSPPPQPYRRPSEDEDDDAPESYLR